MKRLLTLFLIGMANTSCAGVSPSIDFTQTVSEHAMLLVLVLICLGAASVLAMKFFFDRMSNSLRTSQTEIALQGSELIRAQNQIKQNELEYMKAEVNTLKSQQGAFESKHNACLATMPVTYVQKTDYDRFVAEHRAELQHISTKVEGMIKDLKAEIKEDLEHQIERILKLLEAKLG